MFGRASIVVSVGASSVVADVELHAENAKAEINARRRHGATLPSRDPCVSVGFMVVMVGMFPFLSPTEAVGCFDAGAELISNELFDVLDVVIGESEGAADRGDTG